MNVFDHLRRVLGDYVWIGVLVDGIVLDWCGSAPIGHLAFVRPYATTPGDLDLVGLVDVDGLIGAQDRCLDIAQLVRA